MLLIIGFWCANVTSQATPRARVRMTDRRFQRGVPRLREARSQPQPVRPDGRGSWSVVRFFRASWLGEAVVELRFSSSGSVSTRHEYNNVDTYYFHIVICLYIYT